MTTAGTVAGAVFVSVCAWTNRWLMHVAPDRLAGRRSRSHVSAIAEALESRRLLSVYYVSTSGSNAAPGTLDRPFASIEHAAQVAQAGDTVLVRGGTYRETVRPARSGTPAAPIVFESYPGETVTLSGADPITGWKSYEGAIYEAPQAWDLGPGNDQVFADGAMLNEARWPDNSAGLFQPGGASIDSVITSVTPDGPFDAPATATITSSSLTQPVGALDGATIHIAPGQGWAWQTGTVIDSRPGQLTYQYTQLETHYQIPQSGNSFYLTGKLQMLDGPGQWFDDPASGTLYVWLANGGNPAGHDIQAKHRPSAFDLSGLSYIDVRGFNLFSDTILTSAASHDLSLSELDAQYISQATIDPDPFAAKFAAPTTGLLLNGDNILLSDSTIGPSSGNGVALAGNHDTIENCFIHDVDYSGGDGAGITLLGSDEQVLHNTIWNTGRSGITDYFGARQHILNNVIHDCGLITSDGGGVYTWQTNGAGSEIAYNLIYNGRASGFGNTGIFLDNGDDNFLIHHNVVWNVDNALKLSAPAHDDMVYNNTLIGVSFSLGTNYPPDMSGSVVENNVLDGPIWWGPGVTQQHNLTSGDPGFVAAQANDYQLAAASPALDAGMLIPPYTNGYVGAAPDLGAYERGVEPFPAGASAQGVEPARGIPQTRSAFTTIDTASFDAMTGIQMDSDRRVVAGASSWLRYAGLDFGAGARLLRIELSVLGRTRGLRVVARLDGPDGPVVAEFVPRGRAPHVQSARVRQFSGVHDLYLTVSQRALGQIQLDWLTFTPSPAPLPHPARRPHGQTVGHRRDS